METQQQNIRSWDDLIFENRNKSYGAYALRQDYSNGLLKGVIGSIGIAVAMLAVAGLIGGDKIVEKVTAMQKSITVGPPPKIQTDAAVVPPQRTEPVRRVNTDLPVRVVTTPDPIEPDPQPATTSTGTEGTTQGTAGSDTGTTGGVDTGGTDLGTVAVKSNEPFVHAEVMPAYKDGLKGMIRTLQRNQRYPASARRMGKEGTVYVEFVVSDEGEVINARVIKGFDLDCDKEAVRMVEKLTEWTPGMQNKVTVNVKMVLPIRFELAK